MAKSQRKSAQGTSTLRLTSQRKLAYTTVRLRAGRGGGGSALVVAADKAMLWQYMVADRATPTAKAETTMAPVGCRAGRHLKYASQRLFDQNCDAFEGSCLCSTLDSYFWEWRSDPDISPNVSRDQPCACSFIYHQCSKESSSPSNLLYCRHFDAMVEQQGGVHP